MTSLQHMSEYPMKSDQEKIEHSDAPSEQYLLRLYVAGTNTQSMRAIANIKKICEMYLKDCYTLEVIDLYQQPERANLAQIIAIPTLVRENPLPIRRIIGDLADVSQVCASLDIPTNPRQGVEKQRLPD
jgi:circadian clock protein KaiB